MCNIHTSKNWEFVCEWPFVGADPEEVQWHGYAPTTFPLLLNGTSLLLPFLPLPHPLLFMVDLEVGGAPEPHLPYFSWVVQGSRAQLGTAAVVVVVGVGGTFFLSLVLGWQGTPGRPLPLLLSLTKPDSLHSLSQEGTVAVAVRRKEVPLSIEGKCWGAKKSGVGILT